MRERERERREEREGREGGKRGREEREGRKGGKRGREERRGKQVFSQVNVILGVIHVIHACTSLHLPTHTHPTHSRIPATGQTTICLTSGRGFPFVLHRGNLNTGTLSLSAASASGSGRPFTSGMVKTATTLWPCVRNSLYTCARVCVMV